MPSFVSSSRVLACRTRWVVTHLTGVVPGLGDEAAGEGAVGHPGPAGEIGDGVLDGQVVDHPVEHRLQALAGRLGHRHLDVLALAAVALRRDDHPAGDPGRDGAAELAADEVQAGVDAGGRPGAGDDVAVVDEQHVRVEVRQRVLLAEELRVAPVGRAVAAVQQPGLAEHEGARADRQQDRAAFVRPAERVQDALVVLVPPGRRRQRDQVGVLQLLQPVRRDHGRMAAGAQRLTRPGRADLEVEGRYAVVGPVDPEHLRQHAELEQGDVLHQDDSDLLQHASQYGRNLWVTVNSANCGWI